MTTKNTALRFQEDLVEAAKTQLHERGQTLTEFLEIQMSELTGVPRVHRPTGRKPKAKEGIGS